MKKATIQKKPKILVILGPTASGKSSLAVKLAKKYNGEIISADSRQVYKSLDIGTGKITKKEMQGVPHHLLSVVSPRKTFTVADFQKQAEKTIKEILSRNKLPIVCGGAGFYIQSIVDNIVLPEVPPNKRLRKELVPKSLADLVKILKKLDAKRLESIDTKNPVRLIRAIEIAKALGKVPELNKKGKSYNTLQIGLKLPDNILKKKISIRLFARMSVGMVEEARKLNKRGLSFKRMRELGLEYKYLANLLEKKIIKQEFEQKLQTAIWQYSKRQMTWFKKNKDIVWYSPTETLKITKIVEKFLK